MLRGASAAGAITGNQVAAIRRIPALPTMTRAFLANMSVDKHMEYLTATRCRGRWPDPAAKRRRTMEWAQDLECRLYRDSNEVPLQLHDRELVVVHCRRHRGGNSQARPHRQARRG